MSAPRSHASAPLAPGPRAAPPSPFARAPDPAAYVPRPACEEALGALRRALDEGARVALLEGPPGIGKSLVLRVLEERLDPRFEVARLPLAGASFDGLSALALAGLGARSPARSALTLDDAARRLRALGRVLVVSVDDAARLAPDAAEALGRALRASRGGLRALLAGDTGAPRPRLPGGARTVRLDAPMSAAETARYVEQRLARAGEPALRLAFTPAVVAELHARSGGVPGALHALAEPLAEAARPPRAAPAPAAPPGAAGGARTPAYLPRAETDALLARIAGELRAGRRAQLVRGPSGLGKTTLLRELAARLHEPFQPVEVSYAQLAPDDFFAWVVHLIGAPPAEGDPELELRGIAARLERVGGTVVLLIDEAQSLPPETTARLAAAVDASAGALRVVAALGGDADPAALRALGDVLEHRLERLFDEADSSRYLAWRLAGAPEAARARCGPDVARALHRESGGHPRALERLAIELERRTVLGPRALASLDAPAGPAAAPRLADAQGAAPVDAPGPAAGSMPAPAPEVRRSSDSGLASPPSGAPLPARLVAPFALGAGVPLALFALWLWLSPLFSAHSAPARLQIDAPPGTSISVDGRLLAAVPPEGVELDAGVYAVRAALPDGRVVERRVVVWPRGARLSLP